VLTKEQKTEIQQEVARILRLQAKLGDKWLTGEALPKSFFEMALADNVPAEFVSNASKQSVAAFVEVTARAIEVLGSREKALRWLKAPVRSLGDQTPISLLDSPDGIERVEDALGRIEHGVW
jgi:uncharacterized protein (DUF2384 family)